MFCFITFCNAQTVNKKGMPVAGVNTLARASKKVPVTPFCETCIIKKQSQRMYWVIKTKDSVDKTTSDFILDLNLVEKCTLASK